MALVLLRVFIREIIFTPVGVGMLLSLATFGFIFRRRQRILRGGLHVVQALSGIRVRLGIVSRQS